MKTKHREFGTIKLRGTSILNLRGLITLLMLIAINSLCFSQTEPVRKGYYNAFRGDYNLKIADTMMQNRTTNLKANYDAQILLLTNFDSLDVWVSQPDLYYGNKAPMHWYETSFFDKIAVTNITSYSVDINIWSEEHTNLWIRFREIESPWEAGGEWLEITQGQDYVLYKDKLKNNTNYEYQVIIDENYSPVLTFKTL